MNFIPGEMLDAVRIGKPELRFLLRCKRRYRREFLRRLLELEQRVTPAVLNARNRTAVLLIDMHGQLPDTWFRLPPRLSSVTKLTYAAPGVNNLLQITKDRMCVDNPVYPLVQQVATNFFLYGKSYLDPEEFIRQVETPLNAYKHRVAKKEIERFKIELKDKTKKQAKVRQRYFDHFAQRFYVYYAGLQYMIYTQTAPKMAEKIYSRSPDVLKDEAYMGVVLLSPDHMFGESVREVFTEESPNSFTLSFLLECVARRGYTDVILMDNACQSYSTPNTNYNKFNMERLRVKYDPGYMLGGGSAFGMAPIA